MLAFLMRTAIACAVLVMAFACSDGSSDASPDAGPDDEAPLRRCIQSNDDSSCTCKTASQRYFDAAFVPAAQTYVNGCSGVCCYVPNGLESQCVCSDATGPCGPVAGNTVVGSCQL